MTVLELRRGDVLLGTLHACGSDQPWLVCRFEATAAFEEVRPLFDEELRIMDSMSDLDVDAWERAYGRIDNLGLRLVPADGGDAIDAFLLHIQGQRARFRR